VRPADATEVGHEFAPHVGTGEAAHGPAMGRMAPPQPSVPVMAGLSFLALAAGVAIASAVAPM